MCTVHMAHMAHMSQGFADEFLPAGVEHVDMAAVWQSGQES